MKELTPVRECSESAVTGLCMDCGQEFAGRLGLHFVVQGGVVGVEVLILSGDEMHALGRVQVGLIPTVNG